MRSPDIILSARSWSVCPPTSILLVSASVAPHAKSLQCHELTERALHEERGNAFYPRLAIAASPPADGKHPRKNWPRQTSFSRSMDHASLRFRHHKKSPGLHRIPLLASVCDYCLCGESRDVCNYMKETPLSPVVIWGGGGMQTNHDARRGTLAACAGPRMALARLGLAHLRRGWAAALNPRLSSGSC